MSKQEDLKRQILELTKKYYEEVHAHQAPTRASSEAPALGSFLHTGRPS